MATIRSAIQLQDGLSPVIRSMTNALNICINSFESMQSVSNNSINTSSIETARRELAGAEAALNQMESSIRNADGQQHKFNNTVQQGQSHAEGLAGKVGKIVEAYLGFEAAKKGIEATIGGAMEMQQQLFTIQGIMGNKEVATAYFNHINEMANKSVFSLEDFAGSARKFMQFTKNTDSLDKLLKLNERLALVDPTQGFEGAGFALKEMMSGDGTSLKERFGFGKTDIEILKASKDMNTFITQFDSLLSKKGFTEQMLEQYNKSAAAQFDNLKSNIETSFAQAGNGALEKLAPVFDNLNQAFNNGSFKGFFDGLSSELVIVTNLIITLGSWIQTIGVLFQSNWGIIEPIIWGIVAALSVYNASLIITNTLNGEGAIAMAIKTIADWAETAAILALIVAQDGLNAALYACPLDWILIAIILLIAIFYAAVAAVNKFAGTTWSATGIIAGAFTTAAAYTGNIIIALVNSIIDSFGIVYNFLAAFAEFFANVFNDPIGSVIRLFSAMADTILQILEGIASAIDTMFGSSLANAVSGWRSTLQGWTDSVAGEAKIKVERIDTSAMHMKRLDYSDAWNVGYNAGAKLEDWVGSLFATPSMDDLTNNVKLPESNGINDLLTNTGDTAKNTGNIKDKMDVSDEDLKYLRDIAEQDAINRFTTAEIKVDMVNHNSINSELDLDGIVDHLAGGLHESLQTVAEGATYSV